MSEESSSTPLRLKPKVKVEGDVGPEISAPVAGGTDSDGQAGRLRLKPRATGDMPSPVSDAPPAPPAVGIAAAVEGKVRLKPKLSPDAQSSASTGEVVPEPPVAAPPQVLFIDEPKAGPEPGVIAPPEAPAGFKLKPKGEAPVPPPLSMPPPLPAAPDAAVGLPLTDVAPVPAPPPKLRVKPSPELIKSFDVDAGPVPSRRKSRRPVMLVILLVGLLVAAFFGRGFLPGSDPAPESTPGTAQPASLAGQMVGKAEDALAAREGGGSDLSELGIESRQPSGDAAVVPADAGVMGQMPARALPAPPPEPAASPAFQRFVAEMKISGVFQGEPARAMLNGRTIRQGDLADPGLGIRFIGLDVDRRLVLLQEASGAKLAKKY